MTETTKTLGEMHLEMRQRQQSPISLSVFTIQHSLCLLMFHTPCYKLISFLLKPTLNNGFFRLHLVSVYRHRCCCVVCVYTIQALTARFLLFFTLCVRAQIRFGSVIFPPPRPPSRSVVR